MFVVVTLSKLGDASRTSHSTPFGIIVFIFHEFSLVIFIMKICIILLRVRSFCCFFFFFSFKILTILFRIMKEKNEEITFDLYRNRVIGQKQPQVVLAQPGILPPEFLAFTSLQRQMHLGYLHETSSLRQSSSFAHTPVSALGGIEASIK